MVVPLRDGAFRLWKNAPYWQYTVIAAGVFTLLAGIHAWSGASSDSGSSVYDPGRSHLPPPPTDPVAEAHLTDYEKAYKAAAKIPQQGARCEQILSELAKLTPEEISLGRSVLTSIKERIAAFSDAERCRNNIANSDKHYDSFERAVTSAETNPSAEALKAASDANTTFDDFDKSRPRYSSEAALIAKGKGFADSLATSDAHITALMKATNAIISDHSAVAYLKLADAVKQLTDFDRNRLTQSERVTLNNANQSLFTLSESRTRLAKLFPLLTANDNGQSAQFGQQLVEATAAITPFDEGVATPEQKDALLKARNAVRPLAWSLMQDRVSARAKAETPDTDQAVRAVYNVLKDTPTGELNDQQRAMITVGRAAEDALTSSDDRLNGLLIAADAWRQRTGTVDRSFLPALQAITPFDHARFTDQHKAAFEILSRAEAIVRGPNPGLTAETKPFVPIFVFSSAQGSQNKDAAEYLSKSLSRAGFQIAARDDSALLLDVMVDGVDEPSIDNSGIFTAWKTMARVSFNALWVADDSSLAAGHETGVARDQEKNEVGKLATRNAVAAIVQKIDELTKK